MNGFTKGYILGSVAAVSYGTNPLFAMPLYGMGLTATSVLFYRYMFATVILGAIMLLRGDSFRLSPRQALLMLGLGVVFAISSVLLFEAYNRMDVGIASTLLFMEPVFLALMLWVFYGERISAVTVLSIAVCLVGVALLCNPGVGANVTVAGVVLVMLSALAYGIYMMGVNKTSVGRLSGVSIAFYSLLFGMIVFVVNTGFMSELQPIPCGWLPVGCVVGISVFPTIVSLLTVALSIRYIGSVPVSILGALEPITGVLVGCLLFGEVLTVKAIAGVALIICAVLVMVAAPKSLSRNKK